MTYVSNVFTFTKPNYQVFTPMKHAKHDYASVLLLIFLLFVSLGSVAQTEAEPNNTFATANSFTTTGISGNVGTGLDVNDYFYFVPAQNGRIKIYLQYNNPAAVVGPDLYLYAYNKSQTTLGTTSLANAALGTSNDSLILNCRSADTIFVRLNANATFTYTLTNGVLATGTNDVEPNNSFAQATFAGYGTTTNGRIGHSGTSADANDYYKIYIPNNGRFRLFTTYINTAGNAGSDFYLYVHNKNLTTIGSKGLTNRPIGQNPTDTLTIFCREADTMYVRVNVGDGCFSYSFTYEVTTTGTNDVEPNNAFSEATFAAYGTTTNGRIGHSGISADANDYYKIYIPNNGRFRLFTTYTNTAGNAGSDFYLYVHNKNLTTIGSAALTNRPVGQNPTDTLTVFCREADSMYVRVHAGDGCFSYSFSYEVTTTGTNDVEPNNSFAQSTLFGVNDTIAGRIGHSGITPDANDYFKTYFPTEGTMKIYFSYISTTGDNGGDLYAYAYNSNNTTLESKSLTNRTADLPYTDSLILNCQGPDTVFVRFNASSCFSYDFRVEVDALGTSDAEPNNTLATATFINTNVPLNGKVGYLKPAADVNDYHKFFAGSNSSITLNMSTTNTSGSAGSDFYVYLYNKTGQQIAVRAYTNQNAVGTFTDQILLPCVASDTVYLRTTSSGCFAYTFDIDVVNIAPTALIQSSRMGNTFGFIANTTNADSVYWDFDDGTFSSLRLPVKSFFIGFHRVTLKAFYKACNLVTIDTFEVDIEGIESYTPKKAGISEGIGQVILRIFGGGLDTNAQITLTRGSTVLTPKQIASASNGELTAFFNLAGAEIGLYDVGITLSSSNTYTFVNGFEIVEDKIGFDLVATVNGPNRIRTNSWANFQLNVTNDRTRMALMVPVCIVIPQGMETNLNELIYKRSGRILINEDAYNSQLTIPTNIMNECYFDNNFNPALDTFSVNLTDLYQYVDTVFGIPIDTLFDEPYTGKVYHLLVPFINGNSIYKLNFKAKGLSNGNRQIISYVWPHNLRNNPLTGKQLTSVHDWGIRAAAIAEMSPNPALQAVGKSAGYVDIGSQVVFAEFFDWYYDVNVADEGFYAEQGVSLGAEVSGMLVPFGDNATNGLKAAKASKNSLKNATEHVQFTEDMIKNWNVTPEIAAKLKKDLADFQDFLANEGKNMTDAQKQAALDAILHVAAKEGTNYGSNELKGILVDPDNPCTSEPRNPQPMPVSSVTSLDPNEIYGPSGYTEAQFVNKGGSMNYLVTFENVDTAQAPAAVVRVDLKLDPAKFNLSKTLLGDVTIAGQTYFIEQDRNTYFRDIDLRPRLNIIVRLNASLDTLTGDMTWLFTSLDPLTMDIPEDPLLGFLPPNNSMPEGEGSISFTTYPQRSVADGDTLNAYANIYFDANEPIRTGTWTNIIDDLAPSTSLNPLVTIENGNVMVLNWQGIDAGSGIKNYWLRMQTANGSWNPNPLPLPYGTQARIGGNIGETYHLYIFARDSVGNVETKPADAEAIVTIMDTESTFDPSFVLYPNPANNIFSARPNGNFAAVEVAIFNVMGQAVFVTTEDFTKGIDREIRLPDLAQGAYLVHFTNKAGKTNVQKLLIVKVN